MGLECPRPSNRLPLRPELSDAAPNENWPGEELLVTDQDGHPLSMKIDNPGAIEVETRRHRLQRIPHANGNRDSLLDGTRFSSADDQRIVVGKPGVPGPGVRGWKHRELLTVKCREIGREIVADWHGIMRSNRYTRSDQNRFSARL